MLAGERDQQSQCLSAPLAFNPVGVVDRALHSELCAFKRRREINRELSARWFVVSHVIPRVHRWGLCGGAEPDNIHAFAQVGAFLQGACDDHRVDMAFRHQVIHPIQCIPARQW